MIQKGDNIMENESEPVGYGNPPKAHQFQPGQSGNRTGRPKGSKSLATLLREEGDRIIKVRVGARHRRMTKREALARQLFDMAMIEKNIHATKIIIAQEEAALVASQAEKAPFERIRFTLKLEEDAPGPDLPPFDDAYWAARASLDAERKALGYRPA